MNSFSFYGGSVEYLGRLLRHLRRGGILCVGSEVLTDEFTEEQLHNPPHAYAFRLPPPNEQVDVFEDDFKKQHTPAWWRDLFERCGGFDVLGCHALEDADVLYEDMVLFEHEHDIDPFDVAICLEQIEWSRHNRPAKSLFTITARKDGHADARTRIRKQEEYPMNSEVRQIVRLIEPQPSSKAPACG